jgi:hypothetical protein
MVKKSDVNNTTGWKACNIKRIINKSSYISIPSKHQILTESWNRAATVPFIVFIPEINRILMSINFDYPFRHGMILYSDDYGNSWSKPEWILKDSQIKSDTCLSIGLTYLENGKVAIMNESGEIWFSHDYGKTWDDSVKEPQVFNKKQIAWDPILVDKDPVKGNVKRLVTTRYILYGDYYGSGSYCQGFIKCSNDEGRSWSEGIKIPEWRNVNEIALIRAANMDMIAACRTDKPKEYPGQIDHYTGLGVSISSDNGHMWSKVNILYDIGRHHPSMVLMPDGDIVMTYVVRLGGYPDTDDGFKQFGVEAIVSYDNGQTWDIKNRYILAKWQANRKGDNYWWASSQCTSSILLPDGHLLTAYGTGYRSQPKNGEPFPRDIGLVKWKVRTD